MSSATAPSSLSDTVSASERLAGEGYLRIRDVLTFVPVSRSVWWQGIRDGRYPRGVKIGQRATAWRAADIRDLLDRLAQSSHQQAA